MATTVKERFFELMDEVSKVRNAKQREQIHAEMVRLFEDNPEEWSHAYDESVHSLKERTEATYIKQRLAPIFKIISVKYIAETYFNRTPSWFCQRLNGNKVAGSVVSFKPEEIMLIEEAIHDIGKQLLAFRINE